jgi:MFS family permease
VTVATELDRRGLGLLACAHLSTDTCQVAVPALIPFFVDQRGYSYSAAGALVLAATVGSSLIQPLFGHAADRREFPGLMPLGVALAGAGIALAGVAPTYPMTFGAIVVSGIGVAAFHPEAARYANYTSGERSHARCPRHATSSVAAKAGSIASSSVPESPSASTQPVVSSGADRKPRIAAHREDAHT